VSQAEELEKLGLDPADEASMTPAEATRWVEALLAAARPGELVPADNERLIEQALEDPLAPPSEAELASAAELRDALASGSGHPGAELLAALRAPFDSTDDDDEALSRLAPAPELRSRPPRNLVYVAFGAASLVVAAAAAQLLTVGAVSRKSAPSAARLLEPRSTAPLFSDRFDANVTARVDLIASARVRDLRENRYAAWGVK